MPGGGRGEGIKYRRFTGEARRRGYTSRNAKRLAPGACGRRRLLARGLCRGCKPSFLQLDQPRLAVAQRDEGADRGYQTHHLRGLAGRQDAPRAGGDDRSAGLDHVARALDLRQIERDRAIAPHRQEQPNAKAQRCPVACQGLRDEQAGEFLRRALEHRLEREGGLVAGPLRLRPEGSANGLSPLIGLASAAGSRSSMVVGSSPRVARRRRRLAARGHDSVESGAILSSTEMLST